MQQTPLEAIAQAICQRQGRYQRTTPLFAQLVHLLLQGQPVAPEQLAQLLSHFGHNSSAPFCYARLGERKRGQDCRKLSVAVVHCGDESFCDAKRRGRLSLTSPGHVWRTLAVYERRGEQSHEPRARGRARHDRAPHRG